MTWTPERIAMMRELFEQGYTSRQIAAALGGVTRNAVCGYLFRLGLHRLPRKKIEPVRIIVTHEQHNAHLKALARTLRQEGSSLAEIGNRIGRSKDWVKWHTRTQEAVQRRTIQRKAAKERKATPQATTSRYSCTLFQLRFDSCRYPIGDPREPSFRFCGARQTKFSSYCATHHKLTHGSGTYGERRAMNRDVP